MNLSRGSLLVVAVSCLPALTACNSMGPCDYRILERSTNGDLSTGESEPRAAERRAREARYHAILADAGEPVPPSLTQQEQDERGREISDWPDHTDYVDLVEPSDHRCAGRAGPCVVVSPASYSPVYLRFARPAAPGIYDLAMLSAEICEDILNAERVCAPLRGSLRVALVTPPCADGSCGDLDADLLLSDHQDPAQRGPFARGAAHLLYRARHTEMKCRGSFGTIPMGLR